MSDNATKTFNLPVEMIDQLRARSIELGISESAFVRWAITAALKQKKGKSK